MIDKVKGIVLDIGVDEANDADDYTGNDGKLLIVNESEQKVDYVDPASLSMMTQNQVIAYALIFG